MPREEIDSRNKVLLCACKKYNNNDKNGILLVELNLQYEKFYDTGDYEVYCFCPILIVKNETNFVNDIDNIIDTDYFFVGGFDKNKRKGIIKLYKIIFNDYSNTEIEYIQDIIFDNQNIDLEKPITCIIQSKFTGKIFITSNDGNVYLFSHPNISFYLDEDTDMNDNMLFL